MKKILKLLLAAMLLITVCVIAYPVIVSFTGGTEEAVASAIGLNLYWGYVLVGGAILAAVVGAAYGMFNSSAGLLKTVLSFVAVVVVMIGSYLYAAGHTIQIINIENGSAFPAVDTVITETSIVITYIVAGAAIIAALASEVMGALK